jgi:hypothetical protein
MNYTVENNKADEEIKKLKILHQNVESGIYLPMDNENDHEYENLENNDAQIVF